MTLLANRPIETTEPRPVEHRAPQGDAYVTTHAPRPATAGSYVTTEELSGPVPAGAIRGRYVSVRHAPLVQTEGRYTDRG